MTVEAIVQIAFAVFAVFVGHGGVCVFTTSTKDGA
jgi:hypothetical protein